MSEAQELVFELEQLEGRVLLSAAPLAVIGAQLGHASHTAGTTLVESQPGTPFNTDHNLADNLFHGVTPFTLSGLNVAAVTSAPTSQVESQQTADGNSPAPSTVAQQVTNTPPTNGSSQVQLNPTTQQLTDTLTAANGPPATTAPGVKSLSMSLTGGPSVIAKDPAGTVAPGIDHVDLTFDTPMNESTLAGQISLAGPVLLPDGTTPISVLNFSTTISLVDPNNLYVVRVSFSPLTNAGTYILTANAEVKDVNGRKMDQNHNGIPGESSDAFKTAITIVPSFSAGVTIITHGFAGDGNLPGWTFVMADAVLDRAAGGVALGSAFASNPAAAQYGTPLAYGTELLYDPTYTDAVTGTHWRAPVASESTHVNTYASDQEIVLVYDWASLSNKPDFGGNSTGAFLQSAADNLFAALLDSNLPGALNGRSLTNYASNSVNTNLNFHFIGHSRGAVLNALVVGEYDDSFPGFMIDQVTSLDPHPAYLLGQAFGDPWSTPIPGLTVTDAATLAGFPNNGRVLPTFDNVIYADNYYQAEANVSNIAAIGGALVIAGAIVPVVPGLASELGPALSLAGGLGYPLQAAADGGYELDGDFNGIPVSGAYNLNLNLTLDDNNLPSVPYNLLGGGDHATVHLWYLGTILPNFNGISENHLQPASPPPAGTTEIDPNVRGYWYPSLGGAAKTGFASSLISGGQSVRTVLQPNLLETISGITLGPSGRISASIPYAPGNVISGSPLNPSTTNWVFNGDFDNVGDHGVSVPGWSYSLAPVANTLGIPMPAPTMDVGPEASDASLSLEQTAAAGPGMISGATHNELYIPASVNALEFSVEADQTVANTFLTVLIDGVAINPSPGINLSVPGSFISPQIMALPSAVLGGGHSITFTISGGAQGDVHIDNIKLVSVGGQNTLITPNQRIGILQSSQGVDGVGQTITILPQTTQNLIPFDGSSEFTVNSLLSNSPDGSSADTGSGGGGGQLASELAGYFDFHDTLNSYLASGTPTLNGAIEALKGRASDLVGPLGEGIGGNPPFNITAVEDSNGNLSFNVVFNVSKTRQIPIALANLLQGDVVSADSSLMVSVTTVLNLNFSFGMDASGASFFTLHTFKVDVTSVDTGIGGGIHIGSLAANVDQGTANLAAEVTASVAGGAEITNLGNFPAPIITTQTTTPLDIELPVTDSIAGFSQTAADGAKISIADSNLFSTGPPVITISNPLKQIFPFANLNVGDVLSQAKRFGDWLAQFRDSPLFDVKIPFTTDTTLGSAADFAASFESQFYSQFVSLTLAASDPSQSVRDFGRMTADTTFSLTIDSNAPVNLTLQASATQTNSDLGDLAQDFNARFAASALNGKVQASILNGMLTFVMAPGQGTSLVLNASSSTDPILSQAGFSDQQQGMDRPAFDSIQGFISILTGVMNSNGSAFNVSPHFDPVKQEITMQVAFTDTVVNASGSFTVDPSLPLGNLLNVAASGSVGMSGAVTLGFTLGFSFQASSLPVLVSSLVVPVPSNGQLSGDAHFSLQLNTDVPVSLTLTQVVTGNNTSVNDLVGDLNALFGATLLPGSTTIHLGSQIQAYRPDPSTNRIALRPLAAQLGVINSITLSAAINDPVVTEAGFGNHQSAHSGATGLFIDTAVPSGNPPNNYLLQGALTLSASNLSANARLFDFIDVSASGGTASVNATLNVSLTNSSPADPADPGRFYLSQLFGSLASIGTPEITFHFSGSASASLTTLQLKAPLSLSVPGGFSINIPDITNLAAYDVSTNPTGVSVTYPNLGALADFNGYGFTAILQALQVVASNLGQIGAFSFLNDPLPLIGKSVNDLIGYAGQFQTLVNNLANSPAQTLQEFVTDLNTQVDQMFSLAPGVLQITLDTSGPNGGNGNQPLALEFKLNLAFAYANSLPFQLDLSQLAAALGTSNPTVTTILGLASSLIQAQGSGALSVGVGATLTLDFGLDLTNPQAIRSFFYDDTGVSLTAKVTGTNLNFQVGLGSVLSVSIAGGTAALSADGNPNSGPASINVTLSDPANSGRLYFAQNWLSSSNIHLAMSGGVGATLPLFAAGLPVGGSSPANNFVVSIPSLQNLFSGAPGSVTVTTPDFSSLFSNLDFGDLLYNDTGLLLNGLDTLLGDIENGLNSLVLNTRLPLVGNGLAKAADFIQNFRSGLLADLRADVNAAGGSGVVALQNGIKQALWDALGGGGPLNLLVNSNGNLLTGASQVGVTLDAHTGLSVTLHLKKQLDLVNTTANPINLDLGVPGFGLTTTGNVIVKVGFAMDLSFGLNQQDGFYFNTPDNLSISFSVTIPSLHFTGSLAFLQLDISDDSLDPSYFNGQFSVTLTNPNGGSKLTGAELTSGVPLSQFVSWSLTATAYVNLDLVASFGGNTSFPSVDAQFHLRWSFDAADPSGTGLHLWFDNIELDVGSFISGFLGSVLNEVQQVTEPIQPILDLVTERLPIISDLAGQTVTMLTLAQDFGLLAPSTAEFISDAAQVVTLINDIHGLGSGRVLIPFGAFNLAPDSNGQVDAISPMTGTPGNINFGSAIAANNSGSVATASAAFASDLNGLHNFDIPIFDKPSLLFNLFIGKPVTLVEWRMPEFKFQFTYTQSFAIYPPLFAQFGGSIEADINLGFAYDTLGIQEYSKDPSRNLADLLDGFYIITTDANGKPQPALTLTGQIFAGALLDAGVVSGGVNGGLEATVNFFWNDNSDNDGKMRFSEIAADAALGASCIFDIQGKISIFLNAFVNVDIGIYSFHKVWDLGEFTLVDFSITCPQPVLGGVVSGELTLNIGTLAGQRSVGDTSDGSEAFTVRDAGGSASDETVDVTFDNHMQQFTHVRDILVLNPGQGDNTLDFRGVLVPVSVTSGTGNDTVYLSDGNNSVVYCGSGNDTIIASPSATGLVVYGGDGNDTITAGGESIIVFGGSGNNLIKGSPKNDLIFGGGGNDTIYGQGGSDVIVTGPGDNTVYAASGAGDGHNFILADSWLFVMGDLRDVPSFIQKLQSGSPAISALLWSEFSSSAKTLLASSSTTLQQKEVTLIEQLDSILLQQMNLDSRNPVLTAPAPLYDPATFSNRFSGVTLSAATQSLLAINPNPGGQVLLELERSLLVDAYATQGYVKPRASGGADVIHGGSQGDVIDGGTGNDMIFGGAGNDLLVAGLGNVQEFGGAGNDLLIGAEISSISQGSGVPVSILPANAAQLATLLNNMAGSSLQGISLQGVTGGGTDLLVGGGGSDVIFGGKGNDIIYGGNLITSGSTSAVSPDGDNFITGGPGNDVIFTDDATAANTPASPTGISIKSNIWYDANNNGMFDAGETGFAGIVVSLYTSANPPGSGAAVAATTTDPNGQFELDGLNPNNYILAFSLPTGMRFVTQATGNGSNVNANGQTGVFTVTYNQTFTGFSAGYNGPVTVSVGNASVQEGTSGQTPMDFTVTLSGAQAYPVQVQYQTLNGTASAASGDFVSAAGTLTFNPGETSKLISVFVNGNTTYGANEQFQLEILGASLMKPSGTMLLISAPVYATGTIINPNPLPAINISSFDPGDSTPLAGVEGMPATFVVTLSNPSNHTITVNWQTDVALTPGGAPENGAAVPSPLPYANYQPATGTLTFLPGVTSQIITVQTIRNNLDQNNLHFYVDLSNPTFATINQGHGFGLIRNIDPPVSVTFTPVVQQNGYAFQQTVSPDGVMTAMFDVSLSAISGKQITVTYSTAPGTATDTAPNLSTSPDFFAQSGTLVFQPGQTASETITLQIYPSARAGTDFFVNLLAATNAVVAPNPGTNSQITPASQSNHAAVIIGPPVGLSQAPWNISFSSAHYDTTESSTGVTTAEITLFRTPGSPNAVAVFYTTDASAQAGADYQTVRTIVSFAPGQDVMTVPVAILNDGAFDGDKTVTLSLRNPTGGPVNGETASATLTIHNPLPQLVILPPSGPILVGNSSATATFEVELLDSAGNPLTVGAAHEQIEFHYQTVDMTAAAGQDYTAASGDLVIPAVTTSFSSSTVLMVPITVTLLGRSVAELSKTFAVQLSQSVVNGVAVPLKAALSSQNRAAVATVYDNLTTSVSGVVFYDANANGLQDANEPGLAGVSVEVIYSNQGQQSTINTTTNSLGVYTAPVYLGEVSVFVDGNTVHSPYQGMSGAGAAYFASTNNQTQQINFTGTTGVPLFAPVGYSIKTTTTVNPATSQNTGTGHTNSTAFGGPGNDSITVGNGNDRVVGGSWMNATDDNAPVNQGSYNATVTATMVSGSLIWSVNTPSLSNQASITGTITDNSGHPVSGSVVTLFDCNGDPVNAALTDSNGSYTFNGLYFNTNGSDDYVVQFDPPGGDTVILLSPPTNIQTVGARTSIISVMSAAPIVINATFAPPSVAFSANSSGFQFDAASYTVSEAVTGGLLDFTIVRANSFFEQPVVLQTQDGSALQGFNYSRVSILIEFAVGQTSATVAIPIIDTNSIGLCTNPLTFNLALRDPTGRPLSQSTVYLGGRSYGSITDDDIIHGGSGPDIILGDSGNIPAAAVFSYPSAPLNLTYAGGPGNDVIYAGSGFTFVDGQLGNDTIYGGGDHQTLLGGLGHNTIFAGLGAETIDGGAQGGNTIASTQDVATITLAASSQIDPSSGTLTFADGGALLGTASFTNIQSAQLSGGSHDNTFALNGWFNSATVTGGGGNDTLNVRSDTNMILRSVAQGATLSLANGSTYEISGIANISLAGGPGDNILDASSYSGSVTFHGSPGHDTMIGGSGNDTFAFDAGAQQGTDTITGNGGSDTLDFSTTQSAAVTLDLSNIGTAQEVATTGAGFFLKLTDQIENVIDGAGNNVFRSGPGNHRIILLPFGGSQTVTVYGNGNRAGTTLDLSKFTAAVNVDLSVQSPQPLPVGLVLFLPNSDVDNIIGAVGGGQLHGNGDNNTFTFTGGLYTFDGAAGSNTVVASRGSTFILTNTSLSIDGGVSTLANIQNVILTGGASANLFDLTGFTATATLNGGSGSNTLKAQASTGGTITLTNSALTLGGSVIHLNSIQTVTITGTPGGDTFDVTGWMAGTVTLNGAGGANTVLAQAGTSGTMELTNSAIGFSGINGPTIYLNSIQAVTITGSGGNDTFDARGWTGGGLTLNGGGGSDTVEAQAGPGGTLTLTNSLITLSNGSVLALNAIQNATLYGGGGGTLNASAFGGVATLTAGAGGDRLLAGSGNETLVGGAGNDTFVFTRFGSGQTLAVIGNGGIDTLDFSGFPATTSVNVNLSNQTPQPLPGGLTLSLPNADVDNIIGAASGSVVTINRGTRSVIGQSGAINTVIAPSGSSFALTSASLTINSTQVVALSNIRNVTLDGDSGVNDSFTFDLSGWPAGTVTLNGGVGALSNSFILQPQTGVNPPAVTVNVNGSGLTNNTLDVTAFTGVTSLSQLLPTVIVMAQDIQTYEYAP